MALGHSDYVSVFFPIQCRFGCNYVCGSGSAMRCCFMLHYSDVESIEFVVLNTYCILMLIVSGSIIL